MSIISEIAFPFFFQKTNIYVQLNLYTFVQNEQKNNFVDQLQYEKNYFISCYRFDGSFLQQT